jgi:hypothetical protein
MNKYILTTKLNQVLNTMDLTKPKAIRMLKRVDNIRNKLLKDENNYLLEYALIEQCYKIAVEFKSEAMKELYNEMIGKCEFKKKKKLFGKIIISFDKKYLICLIYFLFIIAPVIIALWFFIIYLFI